MSGSHTATAFVGWYNGQPDYRDQVFDFSGEHAVIIGQGNVAADVARILATPVDDLCSTDIAEHALDALADSRIRDITIVGRRGPAQTKFTPVELKELGQIRDCAAMAAHKILTLAPPAPPKSPIRAATKPRKTWRILRAFAAGRAADAADEFGFAFWKHRCGSNGPGRVRSIRLAKNLHARAAFGQLAVATAHTIELALHLVFSSVGYKALAMPGCELR